MAVTIKGIRFEELAITREVETGRFKISSATYSLLSSADKVLAKQPIGGYGAMTLEPSPATVKALENLVESYQRDLTVTLGLEE